MLKAAAQQFLGKSERQVEQIAMETLEGHQRAIMGTMTVEVSFRFIFQIETQMFLIVIKRTVNTDPGSEITFTK